MEKESALAWAAGLFEGEGTIRINSATRRNLGHLICSVVNTDREVVGFFAARWPGCLKSATGLGPNRRPAWVWCIAARKAEAFLRELEPYLVTARVRRKAALALEFQGQKTGGRRNRTDEYASEQWSYFMQMKELNIRGVHG